MYKLAPLIAVESQETMKGGIGRLLRRVSPPQAYQSFTGNTTIAFRLISRRFIFAPLATANPSFLVNRRLDFEGSSHLELLTSSLPPQKWTNFIAWAEQNHVYSNSIHSQSFFTDVFYPGKPVMDVGSADFPNARSAINSPLAKALFGIYGVTRVFFGSDFVTVTKSDDFFWDLLKPDIFAAIMDFYSSGQQLFLDPKTAAAMDTAIHEDDSETVAMIKELLETHIRPAVQDDGGDIEYRGFDLDTGIVKLRMQGACSGCPSSSVTLKSGIENMLMHYVPEVKGVEQDLDAEGEEVALSGRME